MANLRYDESLYMEKVLDHILKTNTAHYSGDIQYVEWNFSKRKSVDFFIDSAETYLARYGKKSGYNREDLMKAIHFILIAWYFSDRLQLEQDMNKREKTEENEQRIEKRREPDLFDQD